MAQASTFLLSPQPRARWMQFDTAQLLKRFFFCERSLLVSMAAWIHAIAPLEIKTGLASTPLRHQPPQRSLGDRGWWRNSKRLCGPTAMGMDSRLSPLDLRRIAPLPDGI